MQKLLNISERVNIAIHAIAYIAAVGENASVRRMSQELSVSETYLAKVLQPLVKEGFLNSKRGARGGFTLARTPEKICIYDLVVAIEGLFPANECLFMHSICGKDRCVFRSLTSDISETVIARLKMTTVQDIMGNFSDRENAPEK